MTILCTTMIRYQAVFRLHGPTKIDTKYEFGDTPHDTMLNITFVPKNNVDNISGILEFEYKAENREQAKKIADTELDKRARIITGALSFTFEEGITVGNRYKVTTADAAYKEQIDSSLQADEYVLSIAEQVYTNIADPMEQEENLKRALNWYSYGLSTKASEDRLVAFWTGTEALVEKQPEDMDFSESQREAIETAKDQVMEHFEGGSDVGQWVSGHFGSLLSETNSDDDDEAVSRVAKEQIDESQFSDEIGEVVEMVYKARNAIVHQGMQIDEATSKASMAEKLLRELLMSSLPAAFANFIVDDEPDRIGTPFVYFDTALPLVFENSHDLELERGEIKKRLFALHRDLRETYRFLPQNYTGEDGPLLQVDEEIFKLNPEYEFEMNS